MARFHLFQLNFEYNATCGDAVKPNVSTLIAFTTLIRESATKLDIYLKKIARKIWMNFIVKEKRRDNTNAITLALLTSTIVDKSHYTTVSDCRVQTLRSVDIQHCACAQLHSQIAAAVAAQTHLLSSFMNGILLLFFAWQFRQFQSHHSIVFNCFQWI